MADSGMGFGSIFGASGICARKLGRKAKKRKREEERGREGEREGERDGEGEEELGEGGRGERREIEEGAERRIR
jgi:hypothetical protein